MRKIIYIVAAFIAAAGVFFSCQKTAESFSFEVSSESVQEGQDLPFTVAITRGDHDGYHIVVDVFRYDTSNGDTKNMDATVYTDGEPLKGEVYFEDHGKKDFVVPGLEAGTYLIRVKLTKGDKTNIGSVVSVVIGKDDPSGPNPPEPGQEEDIFVQSFEIPSLELTDGTLSLRVNDERTYAISWAPGNANVIDFSAVSSDEDVVVATTSNGVLRIKCIAPGSATVTVSVPEGPEMSFPVVVKPVDVPVETIEIAGLEDLEGRLVMEDPDEKRLQLSWTPEDATQTTFVVSSSDSDIVEATMDGSVLVLKTKYPGDATVTVGVDGGPNKTFAVRVTRHVKVTIEWVEDANPSDAQIATKTFPCELKISSDSDRKFPEPIMFSLTLKGVINVTGRDTQSVPYKKEQAFYGNKSCIYYVSDDFLIPCYQVYKTSEFILSITMTLQRYDSLDSDFWIIEYDEKYKTQESRIGQYITSIQQ